MKTFSKCFSLALKTSYLFLAAIAFWISFLTVSVAQWPPTGTLSKTISVNHSNSGCDITTDTYTWTFTDGNGIAHTFPNTTLSSTISGTGCPHTTESSTQDEWSTDGFYYLEATGAGGSIAAIGGTADPLYKVVSILYVTPGDDSSNGYTNSVTNGATSSIGEEFSAGSSVTFSAGFTSSDSVGVTFGVSSSSESTTAFQQTFTNAQSIGISSPHPVSMMSQSDHNNDWLVLWLNPEITFAQSGPSTFSYSINTPVTGGSNQVVDDVQVPIGALQGVGGVTQVSASTLNKQWDSATHAYDLPGLAILCANIKASEYASNSCTLTDQCGCVPSDFSQLIAADPLVSASNPSADLTTASDVTSVDVSGSSTCYFPSSSSDNCRFIAVPTTVGGTVQVTEPLEGPSYSGGSHTINTWMQSDSTQTTQTFMNTSSYTVGSTWKVGSPIGPSLTSTTTLTWTDLASSGQINSQSNSMSVTLDTDEVGCSTDVEVFQDTIYHTFATSTIPGGISSCP